MHSGTTLLHSILQANPTVYGAAYETKYFEYAPTIQHLYPDLNDDQTLCSLILTLFDVIKNGRAKSLRDAPVGYRPLEVSLPESELHSLLIQAREQRTYGDLFRIVFEYLTRQEGKTRWLEKTPQHVFFMDEIMQVIPDVLFVEIVRDPRDALASKKKRRDVVWTTDSYQDDERSTRALEKVFDPLWDALAWRMAVRSVQKMQAAVPDRFISIRYEDLITDPEPTVRKICNFVDLAFTPEMLDVRWINTAEGNQKARKGFVAETIGRWAQTLTPAEVALCQVVNSAYMRRLNYPLAEVPSSQKARIPLLLLGSGLEFFTRLYKRWRLGGRPFMVNSLKNYGRQLRRMFKHP
ncbi:MAG: sulfotransferase [Chloroflexi bacterium]|nr:sulfotransferase [Chloroflexota bacterium]